MLGRRRDFQLTLIDCNAHSLDSFLAFLAAFFSFGFKAGFFLSSLLLLCSLLMILFQMMVGRINCRNLVVQQLLDEKITNHQHTPLPLKGQRIAGK